MKHELVDDEMISPEVRTSQRLGLGAERELKG